MNIEQIKGNSYIPQKSGKSGSASKTNSAKSQPKSADAGGSGQNATNVSLSKTNFDNEVAFAKDVLGNLRQDSLDSLKNIKQKVDNEAYNSKEVHQEIGSLVKNDLSTLKHILSHSPDSGDSSSATSGDH